MTTDNEVIPIAIVGAACRFPGGSTSLEKFWSILAAGDSAHSEIPRDRMSVGGFYHPDPLRPDTFHLNSGHFLQEDISLFDAEFFGISSSEANTIDPQQRVLLEVAYEALENAGIPMESVQGTDTSVFIGSFTRDYEQLSFIDPHTMARESATGTATAILSNRISYFFDLRGTSFTLDTGCSASLIALHQAVNDLRSGRSDLAIAGGVGLILTPHTILPETSLGILSRDGKCFTFDSRANGYGRGEGAGIVILKRLDDAIRDNDTVRVIIRGIASNQDGRTAGITTPNFDAQVRCIKSAYVNAGVGVDETGYVECHGTGTPTGDPIELKAISEAFCIRHRVSYPLLVGSVKPNIGHLEAASGVAGLIKALLVAERGQIPPHVNFRSWNLHIDYQKLNVDVTNKLTDFPEIDGIRRISINSFGFGGTNCHVVLDDARSFLEGLAEERRGSPSQYLAHHNTASSHPGSKSSSLTVTPGLTTPKSGYIGSWSSVTQPLKDTMKAPHLLVFSMQDRHGLDRFVSSHCHHINQGESDPSFLANYAYTMYSRRSLLKHRAFVVARSGSELIHKMNNIKGSSSMKSLRQLKPALIFCGQGAQWPCMGMELMAFLPFRESIHSANAYLQTLDDSFHLIATLQDELTDMHRAEVAQATTTAIQVALVDLLQACEIKPVAVVGHSSGEMAAAYAAGLMSREDAWRLAFYRGKCVANLKATHPELEGRMLAVGLSHADAKKYILLESSGSVAVACNNSPWLVTLSGNKDAVLAIKAKLDHDGIFNSLVRTDTAYHSHHMAFVAEQYLESIGEVFPKEQGKTAMYSSLTGREVVTAALTADYWARSLTWPVLFEEAVRSMMDFRVPGHSRPNAIIEVSPHSVWQQAFEQITDVEGSTYSRLPYFTMLRRYKNASETVLGLIGQLFLHGCRVKMDWCFQRDQDSPRPMSLVDLPPYSWDHSKSFWHETHISRGLRLRQFARRNFIGSPTMDAILPFEPRWRGFFRVQESPWIRDHRIQNEVLYPAAGMAVMAFEGARQVVHGAVEFPSDILDFEVSKFDIKAPMVVPTDERGLENFLSAKRVEDTYQNGVATWAYSFTIFSKLYDDAPFQENAKGKFVIRFLHHNGKQSKSVRLPTKALDRYHRRILQREFQDEIRSQRSFEFYEDLDVIGMKYGPSFRNIVDIGHSDDTRNRNESWASILIPDITPQMPERFEFDHLIHPATLDSIFQTAMTAEAGAMIPTYIESIRVAASITSRPDSAFLSVAKATKLKDQELSANIDVWHCPGTARDIAEPAHIVEVLGLKVQRISSATGRRFLPNSRHLASTVIWKEDVRGAEFEDWEVWLDLFAHKYPGASILHQSEDPRLISTALNILLGASPGSPRLGNYTISSTSEEVYLEAIRGLGQGQEYRHLVNFRAPDLLMVPEAGIYDLILRDTDTIVPSKEDLQKLLRPLGKFLQSDLSSHSQPFGLDAILNLSPPSGPLGGGKLILLSSNRTTSTITEDLSEYLRNCGWSPVINTFTSTWVESQPHDIDEIIISLVELEHPDGFVFGMDEDQYSMVKSLLEKSNRLLWVTSGAQMSCENFLSSPFLGWARTVRSEDSHKRIVCLDLDVSERLSAETARVIKELATSSVLGPDSIDTDMEYAERGGKCYIPRLMLLGGLNKAIEKVPSEDTEEQDPIAHHPNISSSGVYLIFGGFGGLGLSIADWLLKQGAENIALISRSGTPQGNRPEQRFQKLQENGGAKIHSYAVDICKAKEVYGLVEDLEKQKSLRIRGVIHAAGVLRDAAYQNINYEDWTTATNPKTAGSWNLHNVLPKDINFLIFLSSASGVIGNRGQANYSAGNTFQDALARHRSLTLRLHTVSLDLGPIIGAGMAADAETMDRLRSSGFFGIRQRDMLFMLERAISGYGIKDEPIPAQVVVGVGTGGLAQQNGVADPFWARTALFSVLNRVDVDFSITTSADMGSGSDGGAATPPQDLRQVIRKANTKKEAIEKLMKALIEAIVSILPNLRVQDVKWGMTPAELGSDSMRGASIDGWLKRATGVSVGMGINGMPVRKICEEVIKRADGLGDVDWS
ncbi:type I iterative polyketide synthase [Cladorrhinum sp. PSN259]|nr:type I iterative polyketide synthase [Cladorrhinum sp. PSN259]